MVRFVCLPVAIHGFGMAVEMSTTVMASMMMAKYGIEW
jgi:hypothetical protein